MALPLRVIEHDPEPALETPVPIPPLGLIDPKLAHTVAHDLRSPLTAIQMCAESLALDNDTGLRERHVAMILGQARAIAWALDDLVALADDASWRSEGPGPVDLGVTARSALTDLEHALTARGIRMTCQVGPRTLIAWGHESALRRAVRACTDAVGMIAPPDGEVLVASVRDQRGAQKGAVAMEVGAAYRSGDSARMRLPGLPWHRLPLLAAVRVIADHGGTLTEVRAPGYIAARLTLPCAPQPPDAGSSAPTHIGADASSPAQ